MEFSSPRIFKLTLFLGISFGILSCSSFSPSRHRNITSMAQDMESINMENYQKPDLAQYRSEYIFDWPVDKARLTRGYRPEGRRPHLGIDLAAPKKTPVFSAHQGMVIYAGRDFRGFGKMILVESGHGWATLYAHLDKILVEEGQKVKLGESIGLVGNTGRSSGPHLHFEIRKNKGPVDPLLYLPGGTEAARKLASE